MKLNDFKNMLGIDDLNVKEKSCCCAKSAYHLSAAKNAIDALKFSGDDGEKLFNCFNSVQGGHFGKRMSKYKFVLFLWEKEK